MMRLFLFGCLCLPLTAQTQEWQFRSGSLDALPWWSREPLAELDLRPPPSAADALRLLDQMVVTYKGDGVLERKRRIVQVVLKQRAAEQAATYHVAQLGEGTRIERLRGWHVRPHGAIDTLEQSNVVTFGSGATSSALLAGEATVAYFDGVSKGSVVLFESTERLTSYLGPSFVWPLLETFPIREINLLVRTGESDASLAILPQNLATWGLRASKGPNWLTINNLPGTGSEPLAAAESSYYPSVIVHVHDDEADGGRYRSWNSLARWYWRVFREAALDDSDSPVKAAADIDQLRTVTTGVIDQLTYRQVYLSNARGWVPLAGSDVLRRAFGDCKDMVACLAEAGRRKQIRVLPVLANIVDGPYVDETDPAYPSFNHLIAAVPLARSLNLPAEIVHDGQRYLIIDPTAKDTPFGYLPAGYRGRAVMICTESGARWVHIPEKALEIEGLQIELSGKLDANLGLQGTLTLRETGNGFGLRTMARRTHKKQIADYVRRLLDLPPLAQITAIDHKLDNQARVVSVWKITWPLFLRPDGDGFRLPDAWLPPEFPPPSVPGQVRQSPLQIDAMQNRRIDIDLQLAVPLAPVQTEAKATGNTWNVTWQASGGQRLKISQTIDIQPVTYSKPQLADGLKIYNQLRQELDHLKTYQTLLRPGK